MTNVYNPQKSYTWKPSDKFVLTGDQFGTILNTLRSVLGSPLVMMVKNLEQANFAVEQVLSESVSTGMVKELEIAKKSESDTTIEESKNEAMKNISPSELVDKNWEDKLLKISKDEEV